MELQFTVDFIYIGAPRAASTWLYQCLGEHPEVCVPQKKELALFDKQYAPLQEEGFRGQFEDCAPGALKGVFPVTYLSDPKIPSALKTYFPYSKIIVFLRDPVERVHSHVLAARAARHVEPKLTFEEVLEERPRYLEMGYYYKHLEPYFNLYPPKNISIFLYEDIQEKPEEVLHEIFKFLGVAPSFLPPSLTDKVNPTARKRRKSYVVSKTTKTIFELGSRMKNSNSPIARQVVKSAKRLGLDRVLNVIQNTNRIKIQDLEAVKQDPLPQQIKSRLFTFYKEDINRLERLIERDLSHWKEDV